ncbi:hypothetical protein [Bradyrhizobium sp. RT3a]|uniref:hypothetical protein n=1 Tax=unclassified Bradyrhizobium TaxID=2631580 RepID=UPI00339AF6F2
MTYQLSTDSTLYDDSRRISAAKAKRRSKRGKRKVISAEARKRKAISAATTLYDEAIQTSAAKSRFKSKGKETSTDSTLCADSRRISDAKVVKRQAKGQAKARKRAADEVARALDAAMRQSRREAELQAAYEACLRPFEFKPGPAMQALDPASPYFYGKFAAYAAVNPAPKKADESKPTKEENIAALKARSTARQRFLVRRDEEMRSQCERYKHDMLSPVSDNAMQSGPSRFEGKGYIYKGSDFWIKKLGDEKAGLINGTAWQKPFTEVAPRTDSDPMLWRILTATPAQHHFVPYAGHKDDRRRYTFRRSALDATHLSSGMMKTLIRVDIDRNFANYSELYYRLETMVDEGKLPCLPHFVVWFFDDRYSGQVYHPHLIWCLPANKGVWDWRRAVSKVERTDPVTGEVVIQEMPRGWERAYGKHARLYDAVACALTMACEELGADLAGALNPGDFKNPISPHTHYKKPNRDRFMSLAEMAECLGTSVTSVTLARKLTMEKLKESGLTSANSNRFYHWSREASFEVAQKMFLAGALRYDPRSDEFDAAAFEAEIIDVLTKAVPDYIAPRNARERESLAKAIEIRARYAVQNLDPSRLEDPGIDRGAYSDIIPADATTHEAQSLAAQRTNERAVERTREAIMLAYAKAISQGLPLTNVNIARMADRHPNTVAKYGRACRQLAMQALADNTVPTTDSPPLVPDDKPVEKTTSNVSTPSRMDDKNTPTTNFRPEITIRCREGVISYAGLKSNNHFQSDSNYNKPATNPQDPVSIEAIMSTNALAPVSLEAVGLQANALAVRKAPAWFEDIPEQITSDAGHQWACPPRGSIEAIMTTNALAPANNEATGLQADAQAVRNAPACQDKLPEGITNDARHRRACPPDTNKGIEHQHSRQPMKLVVLNAPAWLEYLPEERHPTVGNEWACPIDTDQWSATDDEWSELSDDDPDCREGSVAMWRELDDA